MISISLQLNYSESIQYYIHLIISGASMQTFKQISFQNYIELRFNQKNLHELSQNEALLKYKRNAQLLAEIFSFQRKDRKQFIAQPVITEDHLNQLEKQIAREALEGKRKCAQIEQKSEKYCELMKRAKNIKNEEQKHELIEELKDLDLYDHRHPYFAEGSPFFMNKTEQQFLQVTTPLESNIQDSINFLDLSSLPRQQKNETK